MQLQQMVLGFVAATSLAFAYPSAGNAIVDGDVVVPDKNYFAAAYEASDADLGHETNIAKREDDVVVPDANYFAAAYEQSDADLGHETNIAKRDGNAM